MDVWILTKETGPYSDYAMYIFAITSSAERAKELANKYIQESHAKAVASAEKSQARYLVECPLWIRPPNVWRPNDHYNAARHWPIPTMQQPLVWEPNPDRPGDWHFTYGPDMDETRWSIFRTELDALAPDAQIFDP